jgi:hypothetical protein
MRPAIPIGLAVVVSTAPALMCHDGYLQVVGPKPLVFARPAVAMTLALAKLPPLARETPDPRTRAGKGGNEPVIMPPPAPAAGQPNPPDRGGAGTSAAAGSQPDATAIPGSVAPGSAGSTGPGSEPGGGSFLGVGIPGLEGQPGMGGPNGDDRLLPLLSPQMLVPFFRAPGTTNRSGQLFLPVPFLPAQPAPAASSTATYEQH